MPLQWDRLMCISWVSAPFYHSSYGSKAVTSSPSGALLRTEAQAAQGYGPEKKSVRTGVCPIVIFKETNNKQEWLKAHYWWGISLYVIWRVISLNPLLLIQDGIDQATPIFGKRPNPLSPTRVTRLKSHPWPLVSTLSFILHFFLWPYSCLFSTFLLISVSVALCHLSHSLWVWDPWMGHFSPEHDAPGIGVCK